MPHGHTRGMRTACALPWGAHPVRHTRASPDVRVHIPRLFQGGRAGANKLFKAVMLSDACVVCSQLTVRPRALKIKFGKLPELVFHWFCFLAAVFFFGSFFPAADFKMCSAFFFQAKPSLRQVRKVLDQKLLLRRSSRLQINFRKLPELNELCEKVWPAADVENIKIQEASATLWCFHGSGSGLLAKKGSGSFRNLNFWGGLGSGLLVNTLKLQYFLCHRLRDENI